MKPRNHTARRIRDRRVQLDEYRRIIDSWRAMRRRVEENPALRVSPEYRELRMRYKHVRQQYEAAQRRLSSELRRGWHNAA